MTIKEIYKAFDRIGCCTFATIDGDYPETRIAHFLAYDDEGIYFMTSKTKPFYRQLIETGKVSVCGLCADTKVEEIDDSNILFDDGYFIRITGDVKEISIDEIKNKNNPDFNYCIEDNLRYPAMTTFVLYRAKGEVFDYDFEKVKRDHKLERKRFTYGNFPIIKPGLTISDKCIGCGKCQKVCTFSAINKVGKKFEINGEYCDECGNCFVNCPVNAIEHKGNPVK